MACLFTAFPTVCQPRFLTSHLKLDPNFETRSTRAPLGSSGSSSENLPARKGCWDGSQGSQVLGAGTRLAGLSSIQLLGMSPGGAADAPELRALCRPRPRTDPRILRAHPAQSSGTAALLPLAACHKIQASVEAARGKSPSRFLWFSTVPNDIGRLFGFVPEEKAELSGKI